MLQSDYSRWLLFYRQFLNSAIEEMKNPSRWVNFNCLFSNVSKSLESMRLTLSVFRLLICSSVGEKARVFASSGLIDVIQSYKVAYFQMHFIVVLHHLRIKIHSGKIVTITIFNVIYKYFRINVDLWLFSLFFDWNLFKLLNYFVFCIRFSVFL